MAIVNHFRNSTNSNGSLSSVDKNEDSIKEIRNDFAEIEKKFLEIQHDF